MVIASIFGISQNMHKKLVSFAAYHLYILFFYRKEVFKYTSYLLNEKTTLNINKSFWILKVKYKL